MAKGDKIYIADKETLDRVLTSLSLIGSSNRNTNERASLTLPYSFYNGCAVVYNDQIHLLGGSGGTTSHYVWSGESWTKLGDLPYSFYNGSVAVQNNKIHLLGGTNNSTFHYKWDGEDWEQDIPVPYSFYSGNAVTYEDEIYVIGGGGSSTTYVNFYRFDGVTWTKLANIPGALNGMAVVSDDGIHLIASSSSASGYQNHKVFDGTSWRDATVLPISTATIGSAAVINGIINVVAVNTHLQYINDAWVTVGTIPQTIDNGSALEYHNELYIFGGSNNTSRTLSHVFEGGIEWKSSVLTYRSHYLLEGTKILCNPEETVIQDNVTRTAEGYVVNTRGVVRINFKTPAGRCYKIK